MSEEEYKERLRTMDKSELFELWGKYLDTCRLIKEVLEENK